MILTPSGIVTAYKLAEKLRSEHNGIDEVRFGIAHGGDASCTIIFHGGREVTRCAPDILQAIKEAEAEWQDAKFDMASPELRGEMTWRRIERLEKRVEEWHAIMDHAVTDHERSLHRVWQRLEKPQMMAMESVDQCAKNPDGG